MENAIPEGKHMSLELFKKALDFSDRLEILARKGGYKLILISGGECSENPELVPMIEEIIKRGLSPAILTNGMWLANKKLRQSILRPEWPELFVQVTNDPRFYPKKPPIVDDPRITYVDSLLHMIPLGRFKGQTHGEIPTRRGPSSFNLRSLTRHFSDVRTAIAYLRLKVMDRSLLTGHCTPSITHGGGVVAGESIACFQIGTVESKPEEITHNLRKMKCNQCGLVDGLSTEQKRSIWGAPHVHYFKP